MDPVKVISCEVRDWAFTIESDQRAYDLLAKTFADLSTNGEQPSSTVFAVDFTDRWTVWMDGRLMMGGEQLSEALDALVMYINQRVVVGRPDLLSLHAAAVRIGDAGVLAPAASGSGKSTLCASLLACGADYLSDESVGLTEDGMLVGYAKPISLKAGSRALLDRPGLDSFDIDPGLQAVWQIPASVFGGGIAASARPRLIAVPRFVAGAGVQVSDLSRPQTAVALLAQVQNLAAFGVGRALEVLGVLVSNARGVGVTFGDARDAVGEIRASCHRDERPPAQGDQGYVVWTPERSPLRDSHDPQPSSDLHALLFEEGGLLVRGDEGAMVAVDATGVAILMALATQGGSVDSVVVGLARRFGAPQSDVARDVRRWIALLASRGFVS